MKKVTPFFIFFLCLLLLLAGTTARASMAMPYRDGTTASTAFVSKHVEVLHQSVHIRMGENFRTARYSVEYVVRSDVEGMQIPMLFYAYDVNNSFQVWVDDQLAEAQNIPFDRKDTADIQLIDSLFADFSDSFVRSENGYWSVEGPLDRLMYDWELNYIDPHLSSGMHRIRIEYMATPSKELTDWVKEYTFQYYLSSMKNWRSSGTLDVTIEQTGDVKQYFNNFGVPREGSIGKVNTWHFDTLPDYVSLDISYKPQPNLLARILIFIHPIVIGILLFIALALLHLQAISFYRERNPLKRFSWVVIVGSLLLPFLGLLGYIFSYELIDFIIGEDASDYHGLVFLAILLYPFVCAVYWVCMWQADRYLKEKITRQQGE